MKVRVLIERLAAEGWVLRRIRGSHRQYRHPNRALVVTVPGKLNDDLPIGTLKSILKKTGLEHMP